ILEVLGNLLETPQRVVASSDRTWSLARLDISVWRDFPFRRLYFVDDVLDRLRRNFLPRELLDHVEILFEHAQDIGRGGIVTGFFAQARPETVELLPALLEIVDQIAVEFARRLRHASSNLLEGHGTTVDSPLAGGRVGHLGERLRRMIMRQTE